jgi:adenine specific DNA methylase Mod
MMAVRLVELHRVLKPTGSIYLHCDPTAGPYLRVLMDSVFGPEKFVNEIVWKRSDAKGDTGQGAKHFGRVNDVLLFYAKSPAYSSTRCSGLSMKAMSSGSIDTQIRTVGATSLTTCSDQEGQPKATLGMK